MHNISRSVFNTASPASAHQQRSPAAVRFVTIIDPAFRSGKIEIPIEKTSVTKGRDEWIDGKLRNRDLSLCCLFQKGRCHAQERCHQVHADRDYVASLRAQQSTVVSCCRFCHDTASLTPAAAAFFAANMPSATSIRITFGEADEPNVVPASRVAFTDGLIQQFRDHGCKESQGSIDIPARRVCRLHAKGVCKYGKDCKNVHVCCQLGENVMVRRSSAASSVATPVSKTSSPAAAAAASVTNANSPAVVRRNAPAVTGASPCRVPQAMPVFALPPAPVVSSNKDAQEATAAPSASHSRSGIIRGLDADSLHESSGRLRALVFDVLKCLDDSRVEPKRTSAEDNDDCDDDNFSYFSSTKTSSRTVASNASDYNATPNTRNTGWNSWNVSLTPAVDATPSHKANVASPASVNPSVFLRFY